MPAKTAVTMPAAKPGANKMGAKKSLTIPPKSADNMPRYDPRIIPIIGAVIAARVMAPPCKPTIGKAGMKEKANIHIEHTNQKPIVPILIEMKHNGRADTTIKWMNKALMLMKEHANLNEPDTVKAFIANRAVANGTKKNYVIAYDNFCKYYKITWEKPRYRKEPRLRKIPTTAQIDMLIASSSKTMAVKLSISKETGIRPTELMNLKVRDIDLNHKLIYPTSAKNGNPRKLKLSNKLNMRIADHINRSRLSPNDKVFRSTAQMYGQYYRKMRNHLADKINDQSLKTIRLYDFRHYFATRLYAKTRDILYVKQQMGHKNIESTLVYTQLINDNEEEEYTCKTASNVKEATQLIENGFQYVTDIDGLKLFKQRK